jgi:hypothetical protein
VAIYSLHHSHVGKATQAQAGTAGAHVHYITRTSAVRLVMGEHMPTDRHQARAWLDEREATDRKNGRVIDKLMVALPVELDAAQRADLVRDFAQQIGGGRVAWMAGIHDRGEDAHNPHAHIVIRDKDHDTGKRVFGTSEKGSTDRLREIWEDVANRALERAGIEARIDRRSLAEQGIDREAGLHVGPNVLAMEERGLRPVSLPQEVENGRVIDWPEIDQGRTRADRQREIEAGNLEAEREREKGKEKGKGRAHVMTLTPEAEQRAAAWAEREADRRAEAQRQTAELLAMARQATRPAAQPEPVHENPLADLQAKNLHADPAGEILVQPATPAASMTIQDQARQAMERAADRWKIEPTHQAEPIPAPTPQRPRIDYLARIRQRTPEANHQAEPMPTAEPSPVWQIPTPQPPSQPKAQGPELGGSKVAEASPKAIQRPSYEVVPADRSAQQAGMGRFAQMVSAARLRLVNLAEKLEAAFEPFRQRQVEQVRPLAPEQRPTPRREPEAKPTRPPDSYADDLLARARQRAKERPGDSLRQGLARRRGLDLDGPDL